MLIKLHGVNVITRRLATGERRTYYYHRKTGSRLPDDPAAPEFIAKLQELNSAKSLRAGIVPGTLEALILCFKDSSEYQELKPKTKKDYGRYIDALRAMWGKFRVMDFERKHVRKLREKFKGTPRTANFYLQIFRMLMNFAIEEGLRDTNPAARPRMLRTGPGHKPWPDQAIKTFREKAPPEMVAALMLGLYTGQREGDCLSMTWTRYKDGVIKMVQEKTGEELSIPVHRELRTFLDQAPRKSPVILLSAEGRPFKADNFRHRFRSAVVACGLDGLTFHGLRKKATEMLAEAGCTQAEIKSITGHKTDAMVAKYLEGAQRKASARSAIRKLEARNEQRRREHE